jgi:hypothetical protein
LSTYKKSFGIEWSIIMVETKVPVRQEKWCLHPRRRRGTPLKASAKKSIVCSTILVGELGSPSVGRFLRESRFSDAH